MFEFRLLHFCIVKVCFFSLFLVCVQVCLMQEGDRSTCPLPLLLPHISGDIPLGTRDMVCSLLYVVVSLEVEASTLCGVWQEWSALAFHSQCVCTVCDDITLCSY